MKKAASSRRFTSTRAKLINVKFSEELTLLLEVVDRQEQHATIELTLPDVPANCDSSSIRLQYATTDGTHDVIYLDRWIYGALKYPIVQHVEYQVDVYVSATIACKPLRTESVFGVERVFGTESALRLYGYINSGTAPSKCQCSYLH